MANSKEDPYVKLLVFSFKVLFAPPSCDTFIGDVA